MKWKIFALLLLAGVVVFAGIVTTTSSKNINNKVNKVSQQATSGQSVDPQQLQQQVDPPGTINGAISPELIPDGVAYTLMFRVIGGRQTQAEKNSIRSYLRLAGLGCQTCFDGSTTADDAEIDAVVAVADDFWQQTGVLDRQVMEIKDREWPNPSADVMTQLGELEAQNEAIVAQILASMPHRLSAATMVKLSRHVNERVKHKAKIYPEPSTFPGGPDWQHSVPHHQQH